MAEEYADKMGRKTDAELHHYVTGRAQYRDDAVLAALDELTRRGQPHPDDAAVRPALAALVQAQADQAGEVRRLAEQEATAEALPVGPALYSPATIAMFSILPMSTMLGGGVLLGMNLFKLGRRRALLGLVLFIIAYIVAGSQLLTWAIMQQGLNPFLGTLLFNVPALLAYLLWFWPRYVATPAYRSRSILPPVVVCFLVIWGLQKAMPYLIKQQPKKVQLEMEQLMKR
ncbi:hypothetical protein GCM10022408_33320 [Hymenobacter fastidiosus]|uniref:DUF1129 domain-containing protein n=1 Tax=Hymenobacter fastidiosus TaxID=486264 RepID=A0ABP7SVF1_9BACT